MAYNCFLGHWVIYAWFTDPKTKVIFGTIIMNSGERVPNISLN